MAKRFMRRKRFRVTAGVIAAVILSILLAFNLSPWPGALVIRAVFENDANNVLKEMETHAPEGVASIRNEQYRAGDSNAKLDVYFPASKDQAGVALPTVIWTHGGAWVSGSKDQDVPYFELVAAEGYTVIGINYSLGPEKTYPTAIHQLNDAAAFVLQEADRFHVDTGRIILAGDSADSQLASQLATLVTNPAYAGELGITPALKPAQLRGMVLNCGISDMPSYFDDGAGSFSVLGWGADLVIWAYTGSKSKDSFATRQMSTINYVTATFPPTFITGGNSDPLTKKQSMAFAARLAGLGVETTPLFYADDHQPALAHEYQFRLDTADAQIALAETLQFIKDHTS